MGDFDTVILYTLSTNRNRALSDLPVPVRKVFSITVSKSPMSRHWRFSDNSIGSGAERMQLVFFGFAITQQTL